ncbi:MAG: hypothetical protein GWN01_07555, partial [Nitrosopumilaceae archaeon]|nr:hypothetical protein [Nitrosopumilaceae archaeon]NIX61378.1 hypothetical protein [Nitrosopumilaceae archaeon]
LPDEIQLYNIIGRELEKFRASLEKVEQRTRESQLAFGQFEVMYAALYSKKLPANTIEQKLEEQFNSWWQLAKKYGIEK